MLLEELREAGFPSYDVQLTASGHDFVVGLDAMRTLHVLAHPDGADAELIALLREWADRDEANAKHIPGADPGYQHIGTLRKAADELERLSASPKGDKP